MQKEGLLSPYCHPVIMEQFNLVKSKLIDRMNPDGYRSLLVASPKQDDGKTLTAVNLAISLTRDKTRTVMLIDTDFRRPSVTGYFGIEDGRGLYDHLSESVPLSELLINPGIPRLTILPAGTIKDHPADFLSGPAMHSFVTEVKKRYTDRFIIFDSPPLLAFSDGFELSSYVDGVLMVIRSQKTTSEDLKHALEILKGRRIFGTILNRVSKNGLPIKDYKKYYK